MIITKDTTTNNVVIENVSGSISLVMADNASFKLLGSDRIYIIDVNGLEHIMPVTAISEIYVGANLQSFNDVQEILTLFNTVIFNNSNTTSSMTGIVGEIKTWPGTSLPSNEYMLCDGSLLDPAQYPVLFSAIGTTYGGDGTTTFGLPNISGNVIVGTGDASLTIGGTLAIGDTGGGKDTALTAANLPQHNHGLSGASITGNVTVGTNEESPGVESGDGNQLGRTNADDVVYNEEAVSGALGGVSHNLALSGNTENAGNPSPTPISSVQPYIALNYIIKVQ